MVNHDCQMCLEILIFPVWFIALNSFYRWSFHPKGICFKEINYKKKQNQKQQKMKHLDWGEESSFLIMDEFPFPDTNFVQAQLQLFTLTPSIF